MEFPFEPLSVYHKGGGKITRVTGISHTCDKPKDGRSRDYWYFLGDVEWRDGSKSTNTQIPPYHVCYHTEPESPLPEHGKDEIGAMMDALNDYLLANGEWFREGPHEGWYANVRPQASKRRAA